MRPRSGCVGDGFATDGCVGIAPLEKGSCRMHFSHAILRRSSPVHVVAHLPATALLVVLFGKPLGFPFACVQLAPSRGCAAPFFFLLALLLCLFCLSHIPDCGGRSIHPKPRASSQTLPHKTHGSDSWHCRNGCASWTLCQDCKRRAALLAD